MTKNKIIKSKIKCKNNFLQILQAKKTSIRTKIENISYR